jgi:hypothetical protein
LAISHELRILSGDNGVWGLIVAIIPKNRSRN